MDGNDNTLFKTKEVCFIYIPLEAHAYFFKEGVIRLGQIYLQEAQDHLR